MISRALVSFPLAIVLLAVPSSARADGGSMTAETLFTDGLALVKKGNYAEACPKFEQSYKLEPLTGALLNWAECEVSLGKTATGWLLFREAAARAAEKKQNDRAKEARTRAADLEPNLCRLEIDAPTGVKITRDGVALEPAAVGVPTPIDGGDHTIAALREEGAESYVENVSLKAPAKGPCGSRTITIPGSWPGDHRPALVVAPVVLPTKKEEPASTGLSTRRLVAIGVGIFGVSALGFGAGFGIDAFNKKSDSDRQCFADGCSPEGSNAISHGQRSADISTALSITGVVALGVATFLWLTDSSLAHSSRPRDKILGSRSLTRRVPPTPQ